jgi:hypothetical protein
VSIWNHGYAEAMRAVYKRHPDDLDVATLFADSLMNLTPWEQWDIRTGKPAPGSSYAVEAKPVLDRAMEAPEGRAHPGVLHMSIHFVEMSGTPESALVVADRLRGLDPDAGPSASHAQAPRCAVRRLAPRSQLQLRRRPR